MRQITVTLYNDDGEEQQVTFPAKNEVCLECEGEGYVLREGMRGAYTAEEFNEAFSDEEDREAYFTRGGKYDEICPCCKGRNVVLVPNVEHMTAEQKAQFTAWEAQQERLAREAEEDRRTYRMESGLRD